MYDDAYVFYNLAGIHCESQQQHFLCQHFTENTLSTLSLASFCKSILFIVIHVG